MVRNVEVFRDGELPGLVGRQERGSIFVRLRFRVVGIELSKFLGRVSAMTWEELMFILDYGGEDDEES